MFVRVTTIVLLIAVICASQNADLGGNDILKKVDDVLYQAKDKKMTLKYILKDKDGAVKERGMEALERGNSHRLMKMTSPADQKGIAFLSLPGDLMYLYLPAFGKVRRIASHIKNKGFAGGDLSYEDLEAKEFAPRWNATVTQKSDKLYTLDLLPRPETVTEYSRLIVQVRTDNFYPVDIQYFDKNGAPYKSMQRKRVEKTGAYWEARETCTTNLKTGHSTTIIMESVECDTQIPDEHFTERHMMR